MILAAGYGTRLWPLTIDRAKPAIPFMGRPLVGYVAEYLARFGFGEIAVNLHHRGESVRASLGDGERFGVRFHYVEEPLILGTGGALDNARALLDADTFVVVNGKIATDINLDAALETHRRARALATLVLRENVKRERYSMVEVRDRLARKEKIFGFGHAVYKTMDPRATVLKQVCKELGERRNQPKWYEIFSALEGTTFEQKGLYPNVEPSPSSTVRLFAHGDGHLHPGHRTRRAHRGARRRRRLVRTFDRQAIP